ncbi:MAG: hypothetical protein APF76_01925 [Desulfitibacter sp. BRH_c19]|nr:MAG: hypothetical protein APF76_01925 [Desulfitibacter sp. BRH_c19]
MLLLSEKDVLNSVTYSDVVHAIEESFLIYERKEFTMPDRMHIDHGRNTSLIMPCSGKNYFGTKLITVYPDNTGTNIPVINAVVVLNDLSNGTPVALINGIVLTALRTGAVGGVGVKHLAPQNASRVGIIGAGVQAFYQIMSTSVVRKLSTVYIFDINQESSKSLQERVRNNLPDIDVYVATSVEELLETSEIVITTTTSLNPVLPEDKSLLEGKHFVGIGSFKPNMREFPQALYELIDKVYIDTEHARKESGDVLYPLEQQWISQEQIQTLGSFMLSPEEGKDIVRKKTTFLKSVGMALFDLIVSQVVYEKAIEKGLGQELVL